MENNFFHNLHQEFLLNSEEKKDITDFMNNIYDLNKNYKTLDISEYVEKKIKTKI